MMFFGKVTNAIAWRGQAFAKFWGGPICRLAEGPDGYPILEVLTPEQAATEYAEPVGLIKRPKTADQLAAEGERLHRLGNLVPLLRPSQEHLAVAEQTPFLRSQKIPR